MMSEVEDIVHHSLHGSVSKETLLLAIKDWDLIQFGNGVVLQRDNEIHCACLPNYSISRRVLKEIFDPILQEYGEVVTRVPHSLVNEHAFVKRLGFIPVLTEGDLTWYSINHIPYDPPELKEKLVCQ